MSIILHGFSLSANTYRVRLLFSLLEVPYAFRKIDLISGEHKKLAFLALNPLGQVPVLELDGQVLRDSHAILFELAERYGPDMLPEQARAQILSWLLFDATELHHGVGLLRNHVTFRFPLADLAGATHRARSALGVLETRLRAQAWLELDRVTIADIACYPFVSVLAEAGLSASDWPSLKAWATRIEALPQFVPMPRMVAG